MSYRAEVKWSEQDERGWEYVVGAAFGYPVRIEVEPRGGGFVWRVEALNQVLVPKTCSTREDARAAALRRAADWLLLQAVHESHYQLVRVDNKQVAEGSDV